MDSSLFQEREESVTGIKELVQGMETVEKLVTKVEPSLPTKKHEPTKVKFQTIIARMCAQFHKTFWTES